MYLILLYYPLSSILNHVYEFLTLLHVYEKKEFGFETYEILEIVKDSLKQILIVFGKKKTFLLRFVLLFIDPAWWKITMGHMAHL